jgi:hypothetical protein
MVESGWLIQPLSAGRKVQAGGRIHQFLWRRSRAAGKNAKKELSGKERLEAAPIRFK